MANERFSRRRGIQAKQAEITVREDAPRSLREAVLQTALDLGLGPYPQRQIICRILKRLPDPNNWSEYPNVWGEVQALVLECDWYYVYDFIEGLSDRLTSIDLEKAATFAEEINRFFDENGIGWQLVDGRVEIRGPESFETAVAQAVDATADIRPTANLQIHEALRDLSRRPDPDLTGAVYHAMAALECVVRDVSGDEKATLGAILKKNPGLFPRPLDNALEKVWGFASEAGRHVREGGTLDAEDAQLVVGLAATAVTYIAKKHPK